MKKVKRILTLVSFLSIFVLSNKVNAADITYKTEYYSSIETAIYVDGLENNLASGEDYYIYITQDSTVDISTVISEANSAHCDSLSYDSTKNNFYLKTCAHNMGIFEKSGDYYAFIVKGKVTHSSSFTKIDGPTKLKRPNLLPLGSRIKVSYTSSRTSYFLSQYAYYTKAYKGNDRKIKFNLGKIEDESLLNKLASNDSNAYNLLYEYAKNKKEPLYSGEFDTAFTGVLNYNILKNYKGLNTNEYYYIYYQLDTQNGTYTDLDDIQAYSVDSNGILCSFSYNLKDNNTPKDNNIPNNQNQSNKNIAKDTDTTLKTGTLPYTGVGIGVTVAIVLVIVSGLFTYIKYFKLRDI